MFSPSTRYEDIPVRLEGEQKVAPLQSFKEVVSQIQIQKPNHKYEYKVIKPSFQVEFASQIAKNVEKVGYTSFTPVQK